MQRLTSASFLVCLALSLPLIAQEGVPTPTYPPRDSLSIARATSGVHVDGVLDEQAWKDATVLGLEWEWSPGDNVPAVVETRCHLTYDETNFYVAFEADDPDPSKI